MPSPDVNASLLDPSVDVGADAGDSILASPKAKPLKLRAFGDIAATRDAIYDQALEAATGMPPVENARHKLALTDVHWGQDAAWGKTDSKRAILGGGTLGRRLKGTWVLTDKTSGKELDRKTTTVASIPHLTDEGTFIHRGTAYGLKNQQRLLSGIFTRKKENGEIESHANILSGGPSHHYSIDPDSGVFHIQAGQANIPLLPLLQALDPEKAKNLAHEWSDEIYGANYAKSDASALTKLTDKFDRKGVGLKAAFEAMTLDPRVTQRTLGKPHDKMDFDTVAATAKKLLAVSRGTSSTDDRDHLAFQTFMGPEDLIAERLTRDRGGVRRNLLFKASRHGDLKSLGPSALQDQVDSSLMESGLGLALEESNPSEILDKLTLSSRMGEGGIGSTTAIPKDSRAVQPSQLAFIDPSRTPENDRVGVDTFMANNAMKGNDGRIYGAFIDPKTGQKVYKSPQDIADLTVTFPGLLSAKTKRIQAMRDGKMTYVKKRDVDLVIPHFEHSFSPLGNLVPLKSMLKAQRLAMASRMSTQALPLVGAEAPLVQTAVPGTNGQQSYEDLYGTHLGAMRADKDGIVIGATPGGLKVQYGDGKLATLGLYNNFPYNRRTGITQTPTVGAGQRFKAGQLLAHSNFTDANGTAALGTNARVAFMPWGGLNHEDAIVISEGMAARLKSDHIYQHQLPVDEKTKTGKNAYVSLFPGKYARNILDKLDDGGIIKPGSTVNYGEPLVLGSQERARTANKIHRKGEAGFSDVSVTWQHHDPGTVSDVMADARGGPVVVVKSQQVMKVGDKLSARNGNKGVVSSIIADSQMPHDQSGQPFEVLLNPLGLQSRGNPSQLAEARLGEIAARTGRPIKVDDFDHNVPDRTKWVLDQMAMHGIPDTQDVIDPKTGNKIPNIFSGRLFLMKLLHTAEGKVQGRSGGGYSADEVPLKGGDSSAKRISLLDLAALLSHGSHNVLRDAGSVRGQKNDEYWLQFMQGYTPREPSVPMVYKKFIDELRAGGINVKRDGHQLHIMAMTDKDVDQLAGDRNIKNGETVRFGDGLVPIEGGLFDSSITGGHQALKWSALQLSEPMPSPVFEEPIRRLLGLTKDKFNDVLAGRQQIGGSTGAAAIGEALGKINVDRDIAVTRAQIKSGSKSSRDDAVRKLGYLKSAKRLGIAPADWMLRRVPVLPTAFRPVHVLESSGVPLVADSNYLYRELFEANRNFDDVKKAAGHENAGEERLGVYNAFKAVTGLGDPVTQQSREKNVRGILQSVFGSSPKYSSIQRKLISSAVDNVGRAVLVPNPDMDMDTVGLPEDKAFDVFQRFIVRRLRRGGMPIAQALREVKDRTSLARSTMQDEMKERPVIVNRAPVLHRFGIMALKPVLSKSDTLQMSPLIFKGYGADADGDTLQFHVPADEAARHEALDIMLPSRQLLSPGDFKSPVHSLQQEYVAGAYQASTHKSKKTHIFRNATDAIRAWKAGEVGVGDKVTVLEK